MRVALYVHGRARGHASRAATVTRALGARGHEVVAFPRSPLVAGPSGWRELVRRIPEERAALRDIDVVVADGDQPSLVAAWLEAIPTIAIGHDLALTACQLPAGLSRRALWLERANTAITTYASRRRIAVHFLPATALDPGTRVARPDVPPRELRSDGPVVVYPSTWDADPMLDAALAVFPRVVCFAAARARPGLTLLPTDRDTFLDALARAPFVISTSGSNVLAECVTFGKPVLALHDVRHHEQTLNAALVEHARIGLARRLDRVSETDVRALVAASGRGELARIDLVSALPALSEAVVDEVGRLGE